MVDFELKRHFFFDILKLSRFQKKNKRPTAGFEPAMPQLVRGDQILVLKVFEGDLTCDSICKGIKY